MDNMVKILIVEDESLVALDIEESLNSKYIITDITSTEIETFESIERESPDIILMDINLNQKIDGIELANKIYNLYNIRVIYLTAFTDEETILRAIQTDPFGYINKPYKLPELIASIELAIYKLSKKSPQPLEKVYDLSNGYYYNYELEELFYYDSHIKLGKNEKLLLQLLISAKGNIVTFKEIEGTIWGNESISDSTLRTLVYRLRSKLEYKLIDTQPNIGIKLIHSHNN